ncbi:hypothetical protein, partial [Xanthomonas translucens]|uniref:hypothetical protein n=1 Tax=Xanthomonas campestris pv. translucens TaxID=343 RepID=UPI001E495FF7
RRARMRQAPRPACPVVGAGRACAIAARIGNRRRTRTWKRPWRVTGMYKTTTGMTGKTTTVTQERRA